MSDEVDRLVATSFLLGLRVSQSINNLPPPDRIRYAALLETLQGIAAGEELALEAAADLQRLRPAAMDLSSIQQDYTNLQQQIAQTVLGRILPTKKGWILFVLGSSWQFAGAQGEKPKSLPKWEISKVTRSAEGWLQSQAMAAESWELVTVDASAYYLKRPKQ
jgi:hypothetical protein